MSWKDLLNDRSARVLPWFGFRRVHDAERSWTLVGPKPPEHGWFKFATAGGREATLSDPTALPTWDIDWAESHPKVRGYVVGDRFIPDTARVDPNPKKLVEQTVTIYCVELGIARLARVQAAKDREGRLVYVGQEFPNGADAYAIRAYEDRADSLDHVQGVTPSLDLAFRWITHQRNQAEERRRAIEALRLEEEKKRAEEERLRELMKDAGSALGRRALAERDFNAAAIEALRVSGATFLDARKSYHRGEMVVQYRYLDRRFECVVEEKSLRVVDSGICLTDHDTGEKGDTFFTLESLPGVVAEAARIGKLVVYRHVD